RKTRIFISGSFGRPVVVRLTLHSLQCFYHNFFSRYPIEFMHFSIQYLDRWFLVFCLNLLTYHTLLHVQPYTSFHIFSTKMYLEDLDTFSYHRDVWCTGWTELLSISRFSRLHSL
ncbi:Hypothetical predicted protein, partial [Olea europaea subsp. europaea]